MIHGSCALEGESRALGVSGVCAVKPRRSTRRGWEVQTEDEFRIYESRSTGVFELDDDQQGRDPGRGWLGSGRVAPGCGPMEPCPWSARCIVNAMAASDSWLC